MRDPYYVYGGLQDNGTWGGPSMHREGQILTDFWFNIGGGDGFHTQNDPTDWRIGLRARARAAPIQRINVETRESQADPADPDEHRQLQGILPAGPARRRRPRPAKPEAKPAAAVPGGQPAGGSSRTAAPSASTGARRSSSRRTTPRPSTSAATTCSSPTDRGDHWMIVSPDLTTNDKAKTPRRTAPGRPTGGITPDVTGRRDALHHHHHLRIAQASPACIWVGTDDGNVQVTRNGGVTWTNVRPNIKGVPPGIWCSRVEASHFDEGTCYVDLRRPPLRRLPRLRLQDRRTSARPGRPSPPASPTASRSTSSARTRSTRTCSSSAPSSASSSAATRARAGPSLEPEHAHGRRSTTSSSTPATTT
ncbi:MAG: hypothetical protein M0C28_41910 [Candidatus Moduliflexus flocculans]|nr:hypothetical protein [Candidatus Moduliflexus flocculans]